MTTECLGSATLCSNFLTMGDEIDEGTKSCLRSPTHATRKLQGYDSSPEFVLVIGKFRAPGG